MPWSYHQTTGRIDHNGKFESSHGYAGRGPWKNDPNAENQKDVGPLPRGNHTIADHYIDHAKAGKHVLRLTPLPRNQMFGRSGFLIHGDKISAPGMASNGCIVLPFAVRQKMLASGDRTLDVVK